jgi:hypothetical protein
MGRGLRVTLAASICALAAALVACGESGVSGEGPAASGGGSATAPGGNTGGGSGTGSPSAADLPRDCFWLARSDANAANVLYPDRYATYWLAALAIPPGGHVRLDGRYPRARYASFNLYNPRLEPLDALADVEIAPKPGATQPFAAGADRTAAMRDYAVRVVSGVRPEAPAAREPNTLYSFQALGGQRQPSPLAIVIYRVYVEDTGQDITGGAGLPRVTVVSANGQEASGSAACSALERLGAPDLTTALNGLPLSAVGANTAAFKHLQWLKFFDLVSAQANRFNATPLGPPVSGALGQNAQNAGGFASNVHNNYIYATLARSLGTVGAIAGTAPATPRTRDGAARMGAGQMRYFSFCSNEANTTRYFDCVYDEQVVRDANNRFVLAVSTAAERPANARPECGVTWLDWGPLGQSLIIYRHMLPLPQSDFPQAIQYIPGPAGSAEESTMGRYFPYGVHSDQAGFESLGCPVNPDAIPQRAAQN